MLTQLRLNTSQPTYTSSDMPGKTPNGNGKEPVENGGYPGSKDIDMKDESSSSLKGKGKKGAKDGDEEMTVVVPISKKQSSAPPPNDADGDVNMDDADKDAEEKVDPVAQAVSGNTFLGAHPCLNCCCAGA